MNDQSYVINWCHDIEEQAYQLLHQYEETSLFILSSLKTYGPRLTDDTYSANFKCLVKNQKVVAVFALTRIGNLIIQTDRACDYSAIIFDACQQEAIPLKGVVGDWEIAKSFWDYAKNQLPALRETACKKEILYQKELKDFTEPSSMHLFKGLASQDYSAWVKLNDGFLRNRFLNQGESEESRRKRFLADVGNQLWFGLWVGEALVSIAAIIARADQIGLLGGVYTDPTARRQGFSRDLIDQLLWDAKNNKQFKKIILFVDENNDPAIKLYERLGFYPIGYFALLFGEYV